MSQSNADIIIALGGELQDDYDKRNKKKGDKKCKHNYEGQDNLRRKICNFCKCIYNVSSGIINNSYTIYGDNYL